MWPQRNCDPWVENHCFRGFLTFCSSFSGTLITSVILNLGLLLWLFCCGFFVLFWEVVVVVCVGCWFSLFSKQGGVLLINMRFLGNNTHSKYTQILLL